MADAAQILINRMRKAREFTIELRGFTFTGRRPTDAEAARLHQDGFDNHQIATKFVIDWAGVKESDLVPSGGSDAVEFNAALWAEWAADNPDFWRPIKDKVIEEYTRHAGEVDGAGKP
jgi:hypothetical protein